MATKPKTAVVKTNSGSTAVANYEDRLAAMAAESAQQEANVGGGGFISVKGGQLTYQGNTIKGNELDVVVLTSIHENVYYGDERYDPDNPQPPVCYAFGTDDKDMAPHAEAAEPQHETCEGCPHNEFGTADNGKGKACKNIRRLAMIPGDPLDEETVETATVAHLKVPVTSVKGWASFVKTVATLDKLPPLGVVARIGVIPDPKTQFKVTFQKVDRVPKNLLGPIIDRAEAEKEAIRFPYAKPSEEEKPVRGRKSVGKVSGKPTTPAKRSKF